MGMAGRLHPVFRLVAHRTDVAEIGDFDFNRDRQALFRARPDNIFLVKVNYWINP